MATTDSGAAPPAADPAQAQQLIINAQYLKDFSFESPRAPQSLMNQTGQPEVNLNVDVKARNLGPDVYEVVLTMAAEARQGTEPVFVVEIAFAAVATVRNAPPDMMSFLLFVETPRVLFPFARAIVSTATRDGGFPPLLINPIDFRELLRREQERGAGQTPVASA